MPLDATSGSMRYMDEDGRLHVRMSHISKANVCPYRGSEIPGAEQLGLDPSRIYRLLRDPEELKKGIATFNRLQILDKHIPVTADEPYRDRTVGATGSEAEFDGRYVNNSLTIWVSQAIAGIESGQVKELSAAYYYDADMTPGVFNGETYDGVMRNIRGNHVALVEAGRAGNDVVVMDEALKLDPDNSPDGIVEEPPAMPTAKPAAKLTSRQQAAHGIMYGYLGSRLAQDQKPADLSRTLSMILASQRGDVRKHAGHVAKRAVELARKNHKIGMDASPEALRTLLEVLEPVAEAVAQGEGDPNVTDLSGDPEANNTSNNPDDTGLGDPQGTNDLNEPDNTPDLDLMLDPDQDGDDELVANDGDLEEKIRELLAGKLDDATLEQLLKLMKPADPPQDAPQDVPPVDKSDDDPAKDNRMTKPAMDAAIKAAAKVAEQRAVQRFQQIREAERIVRPYVGDLTVAMDSAELIYKFALDKLGMDVRGVHPSAFRTILELQAKPGAEPPKPAMDSNRPMPDSAFTERYPRAAGMRVLG
jgi:hypothetical protein